MLRHSLPSLAAGKQSFSPNRQKRERERGGKREPQCATISCCLNSKSPRSGVLFFVNNKTNSSSFQDGPTIFHGYYKGGCGSITPLNLINSLNQGFDRGNSLYQKLWTHLDNREKHGLRSTKFFKTSIYTMLLSC